LICRIEVIFLKIISKILKLSAGLFLGYLGNFSQEKAKKRRQRKRKKLRGTINEEIRPLSILTKLTDMFGVGLRKTKTLSQDIRHCGREQAKTAPACESLNRDIQYVLL
jgi:hypothetical protein